MDGRHALLIPPLLGDGQGRYRVHIVGNSGWSWQGKGPVLVLFVNTSLTSLCAFLLSFCIRQSTVGIALARILGVPYISMDRIMWKPGWVKTPPKEFQTRLRILLDQEPNKGWVADGNYNRRGGWLAHEEATDIIWLDPPLLLYFPRVIWRTFLGLIHVTEPCSPGCTELLSKVFFSKESIIWWCLSRHWLTRRQNQVRMLEIGIGIGSDVKNRRMRRIGGWGGDLRIWLQRIEAGSKASLIKI